MEQWFKTKIKYLKQAENGSIIKKTEDYVINALSFTEAEARLQGILEEYIPEYNLLDCTKMNIQDVIIDEAFDLFFNVKVQYLSADPDSGKEKKITEVYLVQADNLRQAYEKMETRLEGSIVDWSISSISETKFVEVFTYVEEKVISNDESEVAEVDFEEEEKAEA